MSGIACDGRAAAAAEARTRRIFLPAAKALHGLDHTGIDGHAVSLSLAIRGLAPRRHPSLAVSDEPREDVAEDSERSCPDQ